MSDRVSSDRSAWRTSLFAGVLAALFVAVPAGFLIATGNNNGRAAYDATAYHARFIRALAEQFPNFDLSNPLTATTPGYHLLLACVARLGASSIESLRLASMAIGCIFVGSIAAWLSRRVGLRIALLFVLPLAGSIYVVGAAAWMLPDNLAWALVSWVLFLCLREPARARELLLASLLLVALVAVRQIHIWAAAVVWVGGLSYALQFRGRSDAVGGGLSVLAKMLGFVLATVPAFAVLILFVRHWGGLTPPRFQGELQGVNLATPAFMLLEFSLLAIGFLPWITPPLRTAWRERRWILVTGALGAIVLAAIPATTLDVAAGRFSGFWSLIAKAPVIAGHTSLLMIVAAPIGAVLLTALLLGLSPRSRAVFGVALLAFAAALTATFYCWQRYHEPLLLMVLPMLCALQRERPTRASWWQLLFPLILAGILAVITVGGLRSDPVAPDALPAPNHFAPGDSFLPAHAGQ